MAETDLAGTVQREYVYFGGQAVARRDASGDVYFRFLDHLGSLRVLTDSTGTIKQELDYDPFGYEITITSNSATDDWYRFISREHDAAGNMTKSDLNRYVYDAENRLTELKDPSGLNTLATYTYDGAGLRLKKVAGGTTTRYIFSGTKVIAEYTGETPTLSKEYVYTGSQLLATLSSAGVPTYHHPDHLSARVNTDSAGTVVGQQGHYPFGESWYSINSTTKWQFTSYERDSESGLDYAMFRYDSSRLGRFMTPDPLAGSISNPQSLNRYAYVLNDPANLVDPLGLSSFCFWNCSYGGRISVLIGGEFWLVYDFETCRYECWELGPPEPPDPIKDRLKQIIKDHPECAALFGGEQQALELIDKMNVVNIDENQGVPGVELARAISMLKASVPPTWAAGSIGGSTVYVDNFFFNALEPSSQDTVFFHELQHNMGKGREIDNPESVKDIIEKCGTGYFNAKPVQLPPPTP